MTRSLSLPRRIVRSIVLMSLLVSFSQFFPPLQHMVEPVGATTFTALSIWNPSYQARAVVNSSVATGQYLVFKVNVTGNPDLAGFDITVRWNPDLLNSVNVTQIGGIFDSPLFQAIPGTEVAPDHVRFLGVILGTPVVGNGTIFTFTLARGTVLKSDSKVKFVDTNANNLWDPGETVTYDSNNNNKYDSASSESVIFGTPPADQTVLKRDTKVRFYDTNGDGIWNSGEMVAYDANNNGQYDVGDTFITGIPPTDTPVGSTNIDIDTVLSVLRTTVTVPYLPLNGFFSNAPGTGDLMVSSVIVSTETVALGDVVALGITVRNMGDIPMNGVVLYVVANDTVDLGTFPIGTMASNTQQTVASNWNTTGLSTGLYILNATVTTSSLDSFSGDNTLELEKVNVVIHDLALVSITAPLFGRINQTVDVKVSVRNLGTIGDLAVFFVKANNTLVKIAITGETRHGQFLNPGQNTNFTFTWDTQTLIDRVAVGTIPSVNTPLSNDPSIKFVDSPGNSTLLRTDPKIRYVDANINNAWDIGEVLVYDSNGNGTYEMGEPVILGSAPSIGTSLSSDGKVKFHDSNANTVWDANPIETIIYDSNSDGKFTFGELVILGGNGLWDPPIPGTDPGESIIYDGNSNDAFDVTDLLITGPTPALGQPLKTDSRILFVNGNIDPTWNSGESVIYDSNENGAYDRGIGRYSLEATVSPISGERDLSNNVLDNKAIDIVAKFAHDLEISSSSLPSEAGIIGANQTVSIAIKNNGRFDETYTASFLLRNSSVLPSGQPLNQTIFQVQGQILFNTTVPVQFTWVTRTLQKANYNLTARVSLDSAEDEDPTSNEVFSLLPMDFRRPPIAVFDFTPSPPQSGTVVTFNATGSSDPEIGRGFSLHSFTWNFGDGTQETCTVTQTQDCRTKTHVYTSSGTYNVALTVSSSCDFTSCTAVVSHPVSVQAAPPQSPPLVLYAALAAGIVAAVGGALFFLMRRRKVGPQPASKKT